MQTLSPNGDSPFIQPDWLPAAGMSTHLPVREICLFPFKGLPQPSDKFPGCLVSAPWSLLACRTTLDGTWRPTYQSDSKAPLLVMIANHCRNSSRILSHSFCQTIQPILQRADKRGQVSLMGLCQKPICSNHHQKQQGAICN